MYCQPANTVAYLCFAPLAPPIQAPEAERIYVFALDGYRRPGKLVYCIASVLYVHKHGTWSLTQLAADPVA